MCEVTEAKEEKDGEDAQFLTFSPLLTFPPPMAPNQLQGRLGYVREALGFSVCWLIR